MGSYILRRLLIAVPSLLGISIVLFTVLALAPGDPFEELATNPNVPPEVRANLRAALGTVHNVDFAQALFCPHGAKVGVAILFADLRLRHASEGGESGESGEGDGHCRSCVATG